jgi:hypothetical protein
MSFIDNMDAYNYQEELIKKTEEKAKSYPMDMSRTKIKYEEEKPISVCSYYTTPVKNSHLYPNFEYIRPYNLDYIAVSNGKIQQEYFDNEIFEIGGLKLKRSELPPAKTIWF